LGKKKKQLKGVPTKDQNISMEPAAWNFPGMMKKPKAEEETDTFGKIGSKGGHGRTGFWHERGKKA